MKDPSVQAFDVNEIMSASTSRDNVKIVVQSDTDIFLVCISQLCVNNLKRLFQVVEVILFSIKLLYLTVMVSNGVNRSVVH